MAKTLVMQFVNTTNKTANLSIENPVEPVDPVKVNAVMDQIIAANVFITSGGEFIAKKGAYVVERNVDDIEL
jgi:hypothetical protein